MRERGSALIITLILLAIASVLAVSMMQASTLDERRSGQRRDQAVAFERAEAGLALCERLLLERAESGVGGVYNDHDDERWEKDVRWDERSAVVDPGDVPGANATGGGRYPRCIIETLEVRNASRGSVEANAPDPMTSIYQITALGTGDQDATRVALRTRFERRGG